MTNTRVRWKSDKTKKFRLTATHNLKTLLQMLIDRLRLISNEKFDNDIRNVILDLSEMDPKGQTFRYGLLKNGVFSIDNKINFDIIKIFKNMEEVYYYLSGIDIFLTENIDLAMEYLYQTQEESHSLESELQFDELDYYDY